MAKRIAAGTHTPQSVDTNGQSVCLPDGSSALVVGTYSPSNAFLAGASTVWGNYPASVPKYWGARPYWHDLFAIYGDWASVGGDLWRAASNIAEAGPSDVPDQEHLFDPAEYGPRRR
jgi:hypothetical protein